VKNSTKLKVWGFCQLAFAFILIVLGSTVYRDKSWDNFAWKPNFALFVPGMFLALLSLPILVTGFNPQITKFGSKLKSETIDYAGKDMKEAYYKTAETVIPAITPSIKTAVSEIYSVNNTFEKNSKEVQLIEAKKLLDDRLISEDEYRRMRNSILGIED
jgi:hypothetical protein